MKFLPFTVSVLLAAVAAFAQQAGIVFIPGGEFLRGRSQALPDDNLKWFPVLLRDDRPTKVIRLDPFYLDEHEVTNAQYAEFAAATKTKPPYYWGGGKPPEKGGRLPVVDVTWEESKAYCEWAGKRLPTEAEWERAARGLAEGATYPWGDEEPTSKLARFDSIDGPVDVCSYPKNYFGLCDMAGNAWEWTADWYDKDYYAGSPAENPQGPETGIYRVLRGGSWADEEKFLTCAYRSFARPDERSPNIGFRCVKSFDTGRK